MLLAGDDAKLQSLRKQFASATVSKREFTGVGFFTHFIVNSKTVASSRSFVIGDVYAEVSGSGRLTAAADQPVSPHGEIPMPSIWLETVTLLLRISFLVGAITDGLAVIPMVFPSIGSTLFGGNSSRFRAEYRFAMGIGASLMAGWTLLLVWGSMDPIGRRDILILTLIPVVVGIIASTVIAVSKQVIFLNRVIPLWIHLCLVSILFIVSYALSFRVAP